MGQKQQKKKDRIKGATGQSRTAREEMLKYNQMTAPRFPDIQGRKRTYPQIVGKHEGKDCNTLVVIAAGHRATDVTRNCRTECIQQINPS